MHTKVSTACTIRLLQRSIERNNFFLHMTHAFGFGIHIYTIDWDSCNQSGLCRLYVRYCIRQRQNKPCIFLLWKVENQAETTAVKGIVSWEKGAVKAPRQ